MEDPGTHLGEKLPCSVEPLVPHRGRMRWLDELVVWEEGQGVGRALVDGTHPLLDGERLHPYAAIELMAQAAAAHEGYRRRHQGRTPPSGFLGSVQGFRCTERAAIGDSVTIECHRETRVGNFHVIRGSVRSGRRILARGRLTVFLGDLPGLSFRPIPAAAPSPAEARPGALYRALLHLAANAGPSPAVVVFPPHFPGFSGHFPGTPILPAVALLVLGEQWLLSIHRQPAPGSRGFPVRRAKFSRPIFPGDPVRLSLEEAPAENPSPTLRVRILSAGQPAATMSYAVTGGP